MSSLAILEQQGVAEAPPGRRERNKLEKQARIVAAARDLFHRQGFAETTTQQIAAEADIGTGTLFLYARCKEDLLIMVFKDEMLETANEIFARLPLDASPVDQMMAVYEHMADFHARDMDLSRVLIRELVMPSSYDRLDDVANVMDAVYGGLADILQPVADDADLMARSSFALYYFALISWLGGAFERDAAFAQLRNQLSLLVK